MGFAFHPRGGPALRRRHDPTALRQPKILCYAGSFPFPELPAKLPTEQPLFPALRRPLQAPALTQAIFQSFQCRVLLFPFFPQFSFFCL